MIDRSAIEVWKLLRDVTNWPAIRADVHDIVVEGGPDSRMFSWFAGPVQVRSCFAIVEDGRRLTWATHAAGLQVVHLYGFEDIGGHMRLNAAESMSGPLAVHAITSDGLVRQIASWLEGVKALAER